MECDKMKVIKFYTNNHIYKGYIKRKEYKTQVLELKNWIHSGNYLVFNKQILNKIKDIIVIWGY